MSSSFRSLAQFLVHGSRKKETDPLVFALETGSQDTGSKMFILYAGGGVYAVPAVMVYWRSMGVSFMAEVAEGPYCPKKSRQCGKTVIYCN